MRGRDGDHVVEGRRRGFGEEAVEHGAELFGVGRIEGSGDRGGADFSGGLAAAVRSLCD